MFVPLPYINDLTFLKTTLAFLRYQKFKTMTGLYITTPQR